MKRARKRWPKLPYATVCLFKLSLSKALGLPRNERKRKWSERPNDRDGERVRERERERETWMISWCAGIEKSNFIIRYDLARALFLRRHASVAP